MAERRKKQIRKRRGFVEVVNALLTLIVLGVLVAGGLLLYGAHSFYGAGPGKQDTTFVVQRGNNLGVVAQRLEDQGLIDSRYIFQLGGLALKKRSALRAGEYKLAAGASMYDILKDLTEGKPIALSVTIPEGFTVAQVLDRLNSTDRLTGTLTDVPPEGSVLPDTYDFDPGATRQAVLDRMEQAMKAKLAEVWQNRDPTIPLTSPEQLVTLASIVEKETPVPEERARIAGVYYNRLAKHMRLQSDPTVVYGVTKGTVAPGRAPTRAELDQQTPYNTYQIDGLPPTPIANPGAEALKAAANPEKNNDIYFVAASLNPKDGHLFAADYADQRRNVAKLRSIEKQQAKADAAADDEAAKDALVEQQAAAAGDTSANQPASAGPADQSVPAATPAAAPPPAGDSGNPAAAASPPASPDTAAASGAPAAPGAATTDTGNGNAPVPMPADQRPTAADGTAVPAAPEKPRASRPARPAVTSPQDSFGG